MKLEFIKREVELYFHIEDIGTKEKDDPACYARYVFMKLARKDFLHTFQKVGGAVNRNGATVMAGVRQFDNLSGCEEFEPYRLGYVELKEVLTSLEESNPYAYYKSIQDVKADYEKRMVELLKEYQNLKR